MGVANKLRETAVQKQKEIQNKKREVENQSATQIDESKSVFDDIIEICSLMAEQGDTSITYFFSGYDADGYARPDYSPPVEKVVKMLKEEGFYVTIRTRDITYADVHGYHYVDLNPWICQKKEIEKARKEENRRVGIEHYLEIKW